MVKDLPATAGVLFNIDHYELHIRAESGECKCKEGLKFIKGFDDYTLNERLAILKHEALHILNDHIHRIEDRKMKPWNYSTDCAINQFIDKEHLPKSVILPELFQLMCAPKKVKKMESSEYYYNLIKDKLPEDSEGDGDSEYLGHPTWEDSIGEKEIQADITKKMIETASGETIRTIGEPPAECDEWLKLHTTKSEYNWKAILRCIVGNKRIGSRSTIMRRDRRFPGRADLRGKVKDRTFNLLVVADVSSSMSDVAMLATLAEVRHVCDVTKTDVDLIQVDTKAFPPEKLGHTTTLIARKGQGGTRLSPALKVAEEHQIDYQAIVVLTDGGLYSDELEQFSNTKKRVIWLIEKDGEILDGMNTGKMIAIKLKATNN